MAITYLDESPTLGQATGPGNDANARNFALASGDPRAVVASSSDPVINAKSLPTALGIAGGASPVPGGMTMGTGVGQAIRDFMLKSMGEEVPSTMQHVGELGASALADAGAIPFIKKAPLGKAIGEAETAGKVITRAPDKLPTAGTVGEYLNTLESQIDNGTLNSAQSARDAYAGTKYINENPHLVGKSDEIRVQAARVGAKAQALLNSLVKGRAQPAAEMARAMTIPNAIQRGYRAIPKPIKTLTGLGVTGTLADALARHISR